MEKHINIPHSQYSISNQTDKNISAISSKTDVNIHLEIPANNGISTQSSTTGVPPNPQTDSDSGTEIIMLLSASIPIISVLLVSCFCGEEEASQLISFYFEILFAFKSG